jgi:hypothetical protein
MGNLNLGALKPEKVKEDKKGKKDLAKGPSFGNTNGKSISLPKGNPAINK